MPSSNSYPGANNQLSALKELYSGFDGWWLPTNRKPRGLFWGRPRLAKHQIHPYDMLKLDADYKSPFETKVYSQLANGVTKCLQPR